MQNQRLNDLFYSYIDQRCSPDEERELMQLLVDPSLAEQRGNLIDECYDQLPEKFFMTDAQANAIFNTIISETPVVEMNPKRITWTRVAAAAVIILLLSVGGYFYFNKSSEKQIAKAETQQQRFKNDVAAPGKAKAMITLADGTTIALDSVTNGTLATQGNVNVTKTADGKIVYTGTDNVVAYNTLSNPRGSTVIDMTLADGSRVWLNAGSSLTYPVAFVGNERSLQMTGEAYFEVAHDAAKPFTVSVNGMNVQVLGTHFNINAYDDENVIRTTLIEGSVKILKHILKPGQQAIAVHAAGNNEIKVQKVNVEEAVAWKNGSFMFSGINIRSIMRQLARWYDVDVKYEGNITSEEFVGDITRSRYENISEILGILEKTKTVSFDINGRSITVMPYKK